MGPCPPAAPHMFDASHPTAGPLHFLVTGEFRTGLAFGIAATAAGVVVARTVGRRHRPVPIAGVVFVAGALAAMARRATVTSHLVGGLVLLVLAGIPADGRGPLRRVRFLVGGPLAVAGGWLVATSGVVSVPWIRVTVAGTAVLGGLLVADFDRRYAPRCWTGPLLAVTIAGVYVTVPDTNEALVLFGAALALLVLGFPLREARMGTAGSLAGVGLLAWVIGIDGFGRQSAIVGSVACLGLLVLEPLAARVSRRAPLTTLPSGSAGTIVAAALQFAAVAFAARVAGARQPEAARAGHSLARGGVAQALELAGIEALVVLALLLVAGAAAGRRRRAVTDRSRGR